MRKLVIFTSALVLAALVAQSSAIAQEGGSDSMEPAHLVLTMASGGEARINRMDWDVNAFAPIFPGTGVRGSDYIDLSGRMTLEILCADLSLIDQRGSEVPSCDPYPARTRFIYRDDPAWTTEGAAQTIVTFPPDLASIPPEIDNPDGYNVNELVGSELDAVQGDVAAITELGMSAEAQAFALASLYRANEMLFQALAELNAIDGLECLERRPSVTPPSDESLTLVQSPVLYVRIGELYQLLGQQEDALRNYQCAAELAQTIGDPADAALAFARWANIEPDGAQAIEYYQRAIDNYAQLGASDNTNAMLEICGLRNCTLP